MRRGRQNVIALLLAAVFALLSDRLKETLRRELTHRPARVFLIPCLLAGLFLWSGIGKINDFVSGVECVDDGGQARLTLLGTPLTCEN